MSLLGLLAGAGSSGPGQGPSGDPDTTPYPMPTARPYQVPSYAVTPTPDGTGSTVHPSVLDFGTTKWHGWRYWMAITPFYASDEKQENPCILVSNDGYLWQAPAGLTNPVYPAPPNGNDFNADTDIEYDPDTDELVLIYDYNDTTDPSFPLADVMLARSGDGVTWPTAPTNLGLTRPQNGVGSPALVRRAAGDWWLFGADKDSPDRRLYAYRATAAEGPWSEPIDIGAGPPGRNPWHLDVLWDANAGCFRMLLDCGISDSDPNADGLWAGSGDGLTPWTWAADPFMNVILNGAWDSTELYRTTFTPHEDGVHYRVWYSARGPSTWRTGYTQVPRAEWPSP